MTGLSKVQHHGLLTFVARPWRHCIITPLPSAAEPARLPQQEHSAEVGDSISEVVRRLEVTRSQKSEGEAYRGAFPLLILVAVQLSVRGCR